MNSTDVKTTLAQSGQEKQNSVSLALSAIAGAVDSSQRQLLNAAENFRNDTRAETQKAREHLEKITERTRTDQEDQLKHLRQEIASIQKQAREDQAKLQEKAQDALTEERARTGRMFRWAIPIMLLVIALTAVGTYYSSSSQTASVTNQALARLDLITADKVAAEQVKILALQQQERELQAKLTAQQAKLTAQQAKWVAMQKEINDWAVILHYERSSGTIWGEIAEDPRTGQVSVRAWGTNGPRVVQLAVKPPTPQSTP